MLPNCFRIRLLKQSIKMEIASKTCSNKYWSRLCVVQSDSTLEQQSTEILCCFLKKVDHFHFTVLFDPFLY